MNLETLQAALTEAAAWSDHDKEDAVTRGYGYDWDEAYRALNTAKTALQNSTYGDAAVAAAGTPSQDLDSAKGVLEQFESYMSDQQQT
ncbi:hypothetical protein [Streptomyces sp. 900105245]